MVTHLPMLLQRVIAASRYAEYGMRMTSLMGCALERMSRPICMCRTPQVEYNMKAINYISKIASVRDKIEAVMNNKPEPTQKSY